MGQWRQAQIGPQRYPRVTAAVPVRVSTVDAERDPDTGRLFFRSIEATTANLSRGGAYVHSWEPLAAGRRVVVAIDLPAGGEVQLVGLVAWTRRELRRDGDASIQTPGYGVEFVAASNAELTRLDRCLKSLEPKIAATALDSRFPTPQP